MLAGRLDQATIIVAKTTDMSVTKTADEIKRDLGTGKRNNLRLVACSISIWSLMLTGLFLSLAATPTRGGEEERNRRGGREDDDKDIRAEIGALQAQVTSLRSTISELQGQVTNLQNNNKSLQTQLAAVQANNALKLGPFIIFSPDPENDVRGPNITFSGANIHIVSGSGATNDNGNLTGLGNLIIGYDEILAGKTDRRGSHNLVIGRYHSFAQLAFGGLVVGSFNRIGGEGASAIGSSNVANGDFACVSGGNGNGASGKFASVTGGFNNQAGGVSSSVSGGQFNIALGTNACVSGGEFNSANGGFSVVIGGYGVTANKKFSIAPQPPFP